MVVQLEPLPIDLARRSFFNTSVADIYRAIDGQSLVAAFTLLLCSLDAMAILFDLEINPDATPRTALTTRCQHCGQLSDATPCCIECHQARRSSVGNIFRRWATRWLRPQAPQTNAQFLYELRCGLVHAHGRAPTTRLSYSLVHRHPELHWNDITATVSTPRGFILNLDSLLAEFTMATATCFDSLEPNWQNNPARMTAQLDRLVSIYAFPRFISPPETFGQMHRGLAPLDSLGQRTQDELRAAIAQLYRN